MKLIVICCAACSVLFGQLYEEYFTGGTMQLDWHPWFVDSLGIGDSMGVVNDPSTPGGDDWAGRISNEYMTVAGLTYAGDSTLTNYSIDAWIYTVVVPAMGPYNGIAIRMDPATRTYYRLVSDFDSDARIRLGYVGGAGFPVALRDWTGSEIPGGVPVSSSWHKFKLMVIADSIWCFYDDIELDGCPIIDDSVSRGYFGVYTFNMMDTASTRCDDIIVQEEGTGVFENDVTDAMAISAYPNPFAELITISSAVGSRQKSVVSIHIYDISGRLVRTFGPLSSAPGPSHIIWDGRDSRGQAVAPGVYFVKSVSGQSLVKVVKIQ
jgi:hypothetical protein